MQAKDIPDDAFLAAIDTAMDIRDQGAWPNRNLGSSACDIQMVLAGLGGGINRPDRSWDDIPAMPLKVVLAKAKALIRRGLITGCACGCRGDFNRSLPLGRPLPVRPVALITACLLLHSWT